MKYYCYNCSETPCVIEVKGAGNTVPFMCPWTSVEHFANWNTEQEVEKYFTKSTEIKENKRVKSLTAEQFYDILEASARHFADSVKPDTEEEVELQILESWWEEFKDYMEEM